MAEPIRTDNKDFGVQRERALLMGAITPGSTVDPMDPLGELRGLAKTAGAMVVDEMLARCRTIHPAHYIGSGKAQEIAARCEQNSVDTIIFDNDLSPAQIRGLEEITGRKVLDRSELILDIFAAHAQTAESRLQVELAQLEYTYPRLHHMWTHLERIAGGASAVGGIGARGPGEKQLEIDRRLVQKRVSRLKKLIAEIDARKQREVRARKEKFSVCLVGYTNAGKSTLMRMLTGADVYVADKLFATLDTRTSRWKVGDGQIILLSDTVGFVRDLPHHLVASFRATLEEAIWADLLIHVADASSPQVANQIIAVETVLDELGCDRDRVMLAMNKIDLINDPTIRSVLAAQYPRAVFISAASGIGADALTQSVLSRSSGNSVNVRLRANCANGKLMNFLGQNARIVSTQFDDSWAVMELVMQETVVSRLGIFGKDVDIICKAAV